jgi:AAA+ ATPase superfamily predicted ATPase
MFIGRQHELAQMNSVLTRQSASMIVIRGRRRIGKSRLIKEFIKPFKSYVFMGLPPSGAITAQDQRNEFGRQFKQQFSFSTTSDDWGDLFTLLAKQCIHGRVIIVFDEISWMAMEDRTFLGKLKTVWDLHFSENPELILILCGSVSAWIEKNILSNTGYLGRPSLHMTIDELPLDDCYQFWKNHNLSTFEILKVLSVTGGVPRYLELIDPAKTAEDNIRNLCFNKNSALYDEFKYIFSDIYGIRGTIYQKIVSQLDKSRSTRDELLQALALTSGGDISEYLYDLELGGFIEKESTWNIASKHPSTLSHYRLRDNYTRFYLKYILPNKNKITKGQFDKISINNLPGWNSILALQFENLVINNGKKIMELLSIQPEDIILSGPYFQRQTARHKGCQIDFMIQTKHDVVYVCEIKFKREEISKEIITEVQEKIQRLKLPKYVSRRAVLIHVNGIKDEVNEAGYFSAIIDFGRFLKQV